MRMVTVKTTKGDEYRFQNVKDVWEASGWQNIKQESGAVSKFNNDHVVYLIEWIKEDKDV